MKDLQEITGQESGLVLYETGELLLLNWAQIEGLPRLSPMGLTCLGFGEEQTATDKQFVKDIGAYLSENAEGLELIYSDSDENLTGMEGWLYEVITGNESDGTVKVFAPDLWN